MPVTAPFGTWTSPISAGRAARAALHFDTPLVVDGDHVYWVEGRPHEGGRCALVRWSARDGATEVTPAGVSVRSRVHEYGGGAFAVCGGDVVISNDADRGLHRAGQGGELVVLSVEPGARYADLVFDRARARVLAIREDHRAGQREPVASIVGVPLVPGGEVRALLSGRDFYASPRISPDGRRLAWLAWSHPHMPWDETELWSGEFDGRGGLVRARRVAGGNGESICPPQWSLHGALCFASDRSGWWNLHRWSGREVQPVLADTAEYGLPQWVFGQTTFDFTADGAIVASRIERGAAQLVRVDEARGTATPLGSAVEPAGAVRVLGGDAIVLGGSPTRPRGVYRVDLATGAAEPLSAGASLDLPDGLISRPEPFDFTSARGQAAHAWLYRPSNPGFKGRAGSRFPLIVISHGGPTASASRHLDLSVQFWTSRGFGVLNVNYGGSTGHGRAYRERLNGAWGIVDVEDCVQAAREAAGRGLADARRLVIRGGSAGGFTTLCALAFHDTFSAGACYYAVADAETLVRETHKFEAHYLDALIGPWPDRADLYRARSPVHAAHRIACPVIVFQGLDDKVVPPSQSEAMVEALRASGVSADYHTFEGEGHGFRRAETIARCLEAELTFYRRVLELG
jgi:dipeptidyl aminopeptidase/acylaminoacyl peptidase